MSNLIVFAGLPGTGKTTIARKLSEKLSYFYLRVDCIEAPFSAIYAKAGEQGEGYEALINLAYENLKLGHHLIIDTVNPLHISRKMFRDLKDRTHAEIIQFELKTKSSSIHKSRIDNRKPDINGLQIPSWDKVLQRSYDKWDDEIDGNRCVIWTDDMQIAISNCLSIVKDKWGQL